MTSSFDGYGDFVSQKDDFRELYRAVAPLTVGDMPGQVYYGIVGSSTLRWIFPGDRRRVLGVMAGWRPYARSSRAIWLLLRMMIAVFGIRRIPLIAPLGQPEYVEASPILAQLPDAPEIRPVVYIGTPGPQRKAVCHMADASGKIHAIVKTPLGPEAGAAVVREMQNLKRLGTEFPHLHLPRIIGYDINSNVTAQTAVAGDPTGRHFGKEHADFLISLRREGRISPRARLTAAIAAHQSDPVQLQSARQWLAPGSEVGPMPRVWQHGDFAPWNLRTRGGAITAYDWEDAEAEGLPVWDIAHFYLQQAFLFRERGPVLTRMEANPAYRYYLMQFGLSQAAGRALHGLYCLERCAQLRAQGELKHADFMAKNFEMQCAL